MSRRSVTAALALVLVACSLPDLPRCPATPEELRGIRDGTFATAELVPGDAQLAVGIVARFVAAPDPAFRGWDVSIEERVRGLGSEWAYATVFVREAALVEGQRPAPGDRVVMIGRIGELPALFVADGTCPVLRPFDRVP